MKQYECLTNDSSIASAIYVPFYAGLELRRHLWGYGTSARDALGLELVNWLKEKPEWNRMSGLDHFVVNGRLSKDFQRRSEKNITWGSNFKVLSECRNMSMISVESEFSDNDFAIPYPTSFHPSTYYEVSKWQDKVRRQNRIYLFTFVGARRSRHKGSIRDSIIDQCLESSDLCKFLDCSLESVNCDNPHTVVQVFGDSVFCVQPPGDTYTRRSIFDSIIAGCIPILFHHRSAYSQYLWHLPYNYTSYSVYIPRSNMMDKKFRMKDVLMGYSNATQETMREEVIRLIPRIVYADRGPAEFEDAFDIAVKGMLSKIETFRRVN